MAVLKLSNLRLSHFGGDRRLAAARLAGDAQVDLGALVLHTAAAAAPAPRPALPLAVEVLVAVRHRALRARRVSGWPKRCKLAHVYSTIPVEIQL